MDEPIILDEKQREAVHAARNAAQAVEIARAQQIQEVADRVTEFIPDENQMARIIREQVENVLAHGTEQDKSMILARVPYICQDIKDINARGERIEVSIEELKEKFSTYPLVKTIVFSFVAAVLLGVLGTAGTVILMVLSK